jgi:hypothetical protein
MSLWGLRISLRPFCRFWPRLAGVRLAPPARLVWRVRRAMPEILESGAIFAGRYRVERELGRGGLGVVYACQHIHTGQKVALKLLLADPKRDPELDSAVREKFKLEQKVWSRAPSEHIVRVIDAGNLDASHREAGEDAEGTPYMVMELLLGETLQQRVERMKLLPPLEVVNLLQQVARGLDDAHGCRGPDGKPAPIVHRDLTPRNVVITTRPDGSTLAKLLDFGIAKQLVEGAQVTQVLLGTRVYTAPEQLLGHSICPQTDIYAFGLIAYYALTGREYGPLTGLQRVSPSQRCRQQGVGGRLPKEFDRWFLRCIEHEPARRFASAGQAAAELAMALAGADSLLPAVPEHGTEPAADAPAADAPAALAPTALHTAARSVEIAGAEQTVAVARTAEPHGFQQPRSTVRLEPGGAPFPAAELVTAGREPVSVQAPGQEPLTPGSAVFNTERPALVATPAMVRRWRWVPSALIAITVGGALLYLVWSERGAPRAGGATNQSGAAASEPVRTPPEEEPQAPPSPRAPPQLPPSVQEGYANPPLPKEPQPPPANGSRADRRRAAEPVQTPRRASRSEERAAAREVKVPVPMSDETSAGGASSKPCNKKKATDCL